MKLSDDKIYARNTARFRVQLKIYILILNIIDYTLYDVREIMTRKCIEYILVFLLHQSISYSRNIKHEHGFDEF